MNFLNPWGLLYAGFIGVIIFFYMLKPKHSQIVVSSTYLWDRTLKDIEANRPWQKLRSNILMILQIVIASLFVLSIMRPYVQASSTHGDIVVVVDSSGSMQAEDVSPTRFERAKEDISKLIDGMLPGQRMAIVSMGSSGQIITEATEDRAILQKLIRDMEPENGGGGEDEALSIASAISSSLEDAQIIIYSDTQFNIDGDNYHSIVINGDGENIAVLSLTYSMQDGQIVALSKIKSFGYDGVAKVECLADGKLADVREVELENGQVLDIYWRDIPSDTGIIEVNIDTDDDLLEDNRAYTVIKKDELYRALLVSEGNIFLEKALEQYPGLEVVRMESSTESLSGYDVYVLDGVELEVMPKDGHIMVLDPNVDTDIFRIHESGEFKPGKIEVLRSSLADELLAFTTLQDIYIAEAKLLSPLNWAETVLKSGDHPLLLAGETDDRKTVIFPFDIQRSDLPLKADFPILIQNILGWMIPGSGSHIEVFYAGEEAIVARKPTADRVDIIMPDGKEYTGGPLKDLGVYKVIQYTDGGEYVYYFATNFPTHTESDLKLRVWGYETDTRVPTENIMTREFWKYILWAVLTLLILEWWVYAYGY